MTMPHQRGPDIDVSPLARNGRQELLKAEARPGQDRRREFFPGFAAIGVLTSIRGLDYDRLQILRVVEQNDVAGAYAVLFEDCLHCGQPTP